MPKRKKKTPIEIVRLPDGSWSLNFGTAEAYADFYNRLRQDAAKAGKEANNA